MFDACARRLDRLPLLELSRWAVEVACCMRVVEDARVDDIVEDARWDELDDFGSQSCRCGLDMSRASPPLEEECRLLLGVVFWGLRTPEATMVKGIVGLLLRWWRSVVERVAEVL